MGDPRALRCVTRAIKNARHLQSVAPHLMPKEEPPDGFGSILPQRPGTISIQPLTPSETTRSIISAIKAKAMHASFWPLSRQVLSLFIGSFILSRDNEVRTE